MESLITAGRPELPKVLAVDDEIEILQSLADLLRKEFHVMATTSPEQALQLLEKKDVALLIADQRMPGMQGTELLSGARELAPDTSRMLLTGYADIEAVVEAINECHAYYYVTKPWNGDNLLALIRESVLSHQLVTEHRRLMLALAEANQRVLASGDSIHTLEEHVLQEREANATLQRSIDNLHNSYWLINKVQEVLPICLECKRVKTSSSNWEELIDFMRENTNFLSHGYCPDCLPKVYERMGLKP